MSTGNAHTEGSGHPHSRPVLRHHHRHRANNQAVATRRVLVTVTGNRSQGTLTCVGARGGNAQRSPRSKPRISSGRPVCPCSGSATRMSNEIKRKYSRDNSYRPSF